MQKYYLLSLLIMSVVIPMRQASQPRTDVGAKKTWLHFLIYMLLWGIGIKHIYWKLPP